MELYCQIPPPGVNGSLLHLRHQRQHGDETSGGSHGPGDTRRSTYPYVPVTQTHSRRMRRTMPTTPPSARPADIPRGQTPAAIDMSTAARRDIKLHELKLGPAGPGRRRAARTMTLAAWHANDTAGATSGRTSAPPHPLHFPGCHTATQAKLGSSSDWCDAVSGTHSGRSAAADSDTCMLRDGTRQAAASRKAPMALVLSM